MNFQTTSEGGVISDPTNFVADFCDISVRYGDILHFNFLKFVLMTAEL